MKPSSTELNPKYHKKPIYYIGAPYSDPNPDIRAFRIKAVTQMTYNLFKQGRLVYSPLTHNVPLDSLGILGDYLSWLDFDHGMLGRSDGLIVLQLPGWENSKGLKAEIDFATEHGLPIEKISPSREFLENVSIDHLSHDKKNNAPFTKLTLSINQMIKERDWEQFNAPKNIAMSLHVEAAEVANHFVWLTLEQSANLPTAIKQQVAAELGDVFINLISLADQLGIDLFAVTQEKVEEIKSRYPTEKFKGKQANLV